MFTLFQVISSVYIALFMNMLFFFYGRFININKISLWIIVLIFMQFIVEAYIRLVYPDFSYYEANPDWPIWYAFKYNSFMYIDSNLTAIHLACLMVYLFSKIGLSAKTKFVYYGLITLTLSRAVIIGLIFVGFLQRSWKWTLFIGVIAIITVSQLFSDDQSFNSKFQIISNLAQVSERPISQNLFGSGFGYVDHVIQEANIPFKGVSGHVHIFDLFLWFGVIGSLTWMVLFFVIYVNAQRKGPTLTLLLFFAITGLSLGPLFFHPFWFFLGALSSPNDYLGFKKR